MAALSPPPRPPSASRAASILLLSAAAVPLLLPAGVGAFRAVVSTPLRKHRRRDVLITSAARAPPSHRATTSASSGSSVGAPSSPPRSMVAMSMSSGGSDDMLPSIEEINRQKSEAYNALCSFHETSASLSPSSNNDQIQSLLRGLDAVGLSEGEEEEEARPECWNCEEGAVAFGVPVDPAAGLKKGVISKPYRCGVQFEMDLGALRGGTKRRGLRMVESIRFGSDDDDGGGVPFVRSIALGENVDVDSVDGSYSLDDVISDEQISGDSPPLPLLPPSLLAGVVDPSAVKFVVEHALAISETERCRCFLLYGNDGDGPGGNYEEDDDGDDDEEEDFAVMAAKRAKMEGSKQKKEKSSSERISSANVSERSYRLLGVILADETKVMPEQEQAEVADEEEEDYAADFISQMIETSPKSESPSSPLDLLETDQSANKDESSSTSSSGGNDMDRLMKSLDKHNQRAMDSAKGGSGGADPDAKMVPHGLGMFGLTSGVWLGDAFVRESIPAAVLSSRGRRGFGKTANDGEKDEGEDRFATWQMGVQKVALLFEWDYHKSVSQSYTWGKVMGTPTSLSSMANVRSDGTVVVNESRRTKKREERRVAWDADGGSYVAGLVGPCYFRAPRYVSFGRRNGYGADAYLTEFMVFYRPGTKEKKDEKSEKKSVLEGMMYEDTPEYYCSRTSRLYDARDGSLMQGGTAFFSLKQMPSE